MNAYQDLEENVKQLVEQLRRLIKDFKPDIIHAHSTYVVFNKVLEILKNGPLLDEIPILLTIHGVPKPLILPSGEKTTDYAELISSCPFDRISVKGLPDCSAIFLALFTASYQSDCIIL